MARVHILPCSRIPVPQGAMLVVSNSLTTTAISEFKNMNEIVAV